MAWSSLPMDSFSGVYPLLPQRPTLPCFHDKTGRVQGQTQAELKLMAHVKGAFSTGPHVISVTASTVQTVQYLDHSTFSEYSVQNPARLRAAIKGALMHKNNSSVFGKIEFFGVLHHLVVSLG